MVQPSQNPLRLHISDDSRASITTSLDLPGLEMIFQAVETLTASRIDLSLEPARTTTDCIGRFPIHSLADESCGILLHGRGSAGAANQQATRQLMDGLLQIVNELQMTRKTLKLREAELATAIPVVSPTETSEQLTRRLEHLLRAAVEILSGHAAAIYLLDDGTTELKLRAQWGLPAGRMIDPPRPLETSVADLEALSGHAVVMEDAKLLAHWNIPEDFASAVCIPVSSPNVILGTLWFFCDRQRDYTAQETQTLEIVAGRVATELERAVLLREAATQNDSKRRHEEIADWYEERQQVAPPNLEGWNVDAASVHRASPVGDFHYWRVEDADRLWLAAGGCPLDSATSMVATSFLRGAVQAATVGNAPTDVVMQRLNETIWSSSPGNEMQSLFLGWIDLTTGRMSSSAAGQVDAYILRPHVWEPIVQLGPPLGFDPDHLYDVRPHTIDPGDVLLVISDGPSSMPHRGGHVLPTTQLAETLLRHVHLSAAELSQMAAEILRAQLPDERARSVLVVKRQDDPSPLEA